MVWGKFRDIYQKLAKKNRAALKVGRHKIKMTVVKNPNILVVNRFKQCGATSEVAAGGGFVVVVVVVVVVMVVVVVLLLWL